jgi:hypothetical protein
VLVSVVATSAVSSDPSGDNVERVEETQVCFQGIGGSDLEALGMPAAVHSKTMSSTEVGRERTECLVQHKCTLSCPPRARKQVLSGPWSLDWLQEQNLYSAKERPKKGISIRGVVLKEGHPGPSKMRVG